MTPSTFNRVAGRPPDEEVLRHRLVARVDAFDAADLLDQVPQRAVHEVLIELTVPDAVRKGDLSDLTRHARAEPQRRPDEPLGQGKQIGLDCHRRDARAAGRFCGECLCD
jgi:hypothetical protein